MPAAYSVDLRKRALALMEERSLKRQEIARLLNIGESTLYSWQSRKTKGLGIAPLPHTGGVASELDRSVLAELVAAQNDLTLEEYANAYAERTGRRFHPDHLCRVLGQMRLRRKSQSAPRR
ncbi:MAG TPA: helix-turn-helix domain-containing protein [Longimicrobium sp.]|jgi:transposase